ncbi:MAG: hypothetical protein KC587_17900 [Nitrospira sp.]|nr:hypothetical protein [Dokdonella sp.]MCA9458546.1 hypothetical protein [Nitrospira sp.]
MKRLVVVLAIIFFLIIAMFLPQVPGFTVTHMAKTGLVVDSETGKPMPNVIVIASGWASQGPVFFGQASYNQLYRIVTRTDSEGRYRIPSNWDNWTIAAPGFDYQMGWAITVFKTGYAVVGDDEAWSFDGYGRANHFPLSGLVVPKFSVRGGFVEVEPIKVYKPTLSLDEAAVYYSGIKNVGHPHPLSTEVGDIEIRTEGYDLLAPWVCSTDPSAEVSWSAVASLMGFSANRHEAFKLFEKLDPGVSTAGADQMRKTSAKIACEVITSGRDLP